MTCVLPTLQGLQVCCNNVHNGWWCLCLSPATATRYHSAIAIYRMLQFPQIMLALRCCRILQYSLRFGYITCHFICFTIIIYNRYEIHYPIFTLCNTMPSDLRILPWSIVGLLCFFLLIGIVTVRTLIPADVTGFQVKPTLPSDLANIHWSIISSWCCVLIIPIRIVAFIALLPVQITGSLVKHLEFSQGPLSLAGGGDDILLITLFTSAINISVEAEWLHTSLHTQSEVLETPHGRITPPLAAIPCVALHITFRTPFGYFFSLCRYSILNKHSGIVANCDHTLELVHWVYACIGIAMHGVMLRISLFTFPLYQARGALEKVEMLCYYPAVRIHAIALIQEISARVSEIQIWER